MSIVRGTDGNDNLQGEDVANGGDAMNGFGGDDTLDGRAGNDNIHGDAGNDHLLGGEGNDVLDGGLDEGPDQDILDGGNGIDTATYAQVQHGMTVDLSTGQSFDGNFDNIDSLISIENVTGTNFADKLFGDGGANGIQGADGNDVIDGKGGNDNLSGNAGDDTLLGRVGDDILTGNKGNDALAGGAGADTFRYFLTSDSGVGLGHRDVVTDFVHGTDKLDLHFIDAKTGVGAGGDQAFTFIGSSAFTAEGQVRFEFEGQHTVVQLNTSGVGVAESEIQLSGHVNLSAGDFVL